MILATDTFIEGKMRVAGGGLRPPMAELFGNVTIMLLRGQRSTQPVMG